MKISKKTYNLIVRLGICLIGAFIVVGLFKPQWLQIFYINKAPTFYILGVIFSAYTLALVYSTFKNEVDISAKVTQLIRAPLYLCISFFCFYYAYMQS